MRGLETISTVFPPHQQAQVRVQLSTTLMGVCTQQLLPTRDGKGRCVACEVLVPTPAVRHHIREGSTQQIPGAIQMGGKSGMQTMDGALADLVRTGTISEELAFKKSSDPDTFARLLGQNAA